MRDREEHTEQSALTTWDNKGKMHGIWQRLIFCFWLKIYRKRMCSQDNPSLIMFEISWPLCSNNTLRDSGVQDFTAVFITIILVSITQVQSHVPVFASSAFPWSNSRGTWLKLPSCITKLQAGPDDPEEATDWFWTLTSTEELKTRKWCQAT